MARSGSTRATSVVLPSHTLRAASNSSSGPVGSEDRHTYSCGFASRTLTAILSSTPPDPTRPGTLPADPPGVG
ncbi:hypothetical protein GCM10022204_09010 [Microlunatus aurantiacus]|uniref:Uncharacterized protein n=1 Tax=Microlunatus aurantiacus TaxID=446786 RepID=A0ABP7CS03_9ACTN